MFLTELTSTLDEGSLDSENLKMLLAKMLPEYTPFLATSTPQLQPDAEGDVLPLASA